VGIEPRTLSGHEGLAVDSEAIVLVPFGEQMMPNAARSSSPNLPCLAKKRVFSSACAIFHQMAPSPLFGFSFFQTEAWSSREAEAIVRSSVSLGMSPAPI
jgi:hypothetical protein